MSKAKPVNRIGERLGINDRSRELLKSLSVGGICRDPHNNNDNMSFADFFVEGGEPEALFPRRRSW